METMKEKSTAAAITVRHSSSHSGSAGRGGREGRRSWEGAPVPTAGVCRGRLSRRQVQRAVECESSAHTHMAPTVWQGLYHRFLLQRLWSDSSTRAKRPREFKQLA